MTRKVAVYARVSTEYEYEAQLSALDNQVQYYDDILQQHPDWYLYKKYIDEGITGSSIKKRKEFMSMLEDAKELIKVINNILYKGSKIVIYNNTLFAIAL